jgi:putative ABC transport system ATP-binding protein
MPDIVIANLTKTYRQGRSVVHALEDVTLRIRQGEFVAVAGRSGSGKTTLLDIIGLLLSPTSGSLRFDGLETASLSDGARARLRNQQEGFVFQEYNLLPTLDLLQNVMLPLRYTRNGAGKAGRERALRLIDEVGLGARLRHRPRELSGGEQQRAAIARALVNRPAVVLADEPTGAVDTRTGADLIALMRRINRREGVTFAVVTHDPGIAAGADRVVRLSDGRLLTGRAQ